jgi:hypothetical protein
MAPALIEYLEPPLCALYDRAKPIAAVIDRELSIGGERHSAPHAETSVK